MEKHLTKLEHVVGQRVYHLVCESSAPLYEVKDALVKFLIYIDKVEEAAKAAPPLQLDETHEEINEE